MSIRFRVTHLISTPVPDGVDCDPYEARPRDIARHVMPEQVHGVVTWHAARAVAVECRVGDGAEVEVLHVLKTPDSHERWPINDPD